MKMKYRDMYLHLASATQIARDMLEGAEEQSASGEKAAAILRRALNKTDIELVTNIALKKRNLLGDNHENFSS